MLPDVETEDWGTSFRERGVLIRGTFDNQGSIRTDAQPGPAAAEACGSGFVELFLEVIEGAEGGIDCSGEIAGGFSATGRGENGPEEGVVGVSAAVIADNGTNRFRHGIEVFYEVFNGFGGEG